MVRQHQELEVYKKAFAAAMQIFEISKGFPKEEAFSLTNQIRRSSRSVCANLAEAWRKRRYEAAFVAKISDAEAEAAETETWIQFAVKCGYFDREIAKQLFLAYEEIIAMMVSMSINSKKWCEPLNSEARRRSRI